MKFPSLFRRAAPEVKANPVGAAYVVPGGAEWSRPSNVRAYIEEGYQQNVIVYRAVQEITRAVADLTLEVHKGETVMDTHPALDLLSRPNPMQGWDGFIKQCFTDFLLTGEMAIVSPVDGKPAELWSVNPIDIDVKPGPGGIPSAYIHKLNASTVRFDVDRLTGNSNLFFFKSYNPMNYWRGQAALVAAGLAADTHNAGLKWNYRLLKNSARPSGLIELPAGVGGEIVTQLTEWFKRRMQGENNAGEIPVLSGGAKWVPMDNNPRDMDFVTTQKESAKLIASAFGVPLPLIDNDASTFNNLEQAKERFYTDTIIPMFNEFLAQFSAWLLPRFADGLVFGINMDDIAALEASRTRTFDRTIKAVQAKVMTVDEGRIALGYVPMGGASAILDPMAGINVVGDAKAAADLAYGT